MNSSDFLGWICILLIILCILESSVIVFLTCKLLDKREIKMDTKTDTKMDDKNGNKKHSKSEEKKKNQNQKYSSKSPFCIMLMDSNRKILNPRGISKKFVKIVRTPTANEIVETVDETVTLIDKPPEKVVISTGVNDLDNVNEETVVKRIENGVNKIKSVWPQSKVILSKLTVIKGRSNQKVNDMIQRYADTNNLMTITHDRIKEEHLRPGDDDRHIIRKYAGLFAIAFKKAVNSQ